MVKSSFLYVNCSKRPDSNDDLSRQAPDKRKSRVKRKVVVSAGITRMLWRDLQWLSKEASRPDSLFKRIHARVRIHAESIAFYGGGGAEREFAERQFDQVLNAFLAPTLYTKNVLPRQARDKHRESAQKERWCSIRCSSTSGVFSG